MFRLLVPLQVSLVILAVETLPVLITLNLLLETVHLICRLELLTLCSLFNLRILQECCLLFLLLLLPVAIPKHLISILVSAAMPLLLSCHTLIALVKHDPLCVCLLDQRRRLLHIEVVQQHLMAAGRLIRSLEFVDEFFFAVFKVS